MKEILETIIKSLVEDEKEVIITEKEVIITEKEDEKYHNFEVKVANQDMGKVIGKQGRVAKSIRTVMKSIAGKEHKKVNIEFLED